MSEGRRLIAESELAVFAGVVLRTPEKWRNAGLIASDIQEGPPTRQTHFYWDTTVETFFKRSAVGFGERRVPSLDKFWHPGGLVSTKEAAQVLNLARQTVVALIHKGELGAFSLSHATMVVDAKDLARYAAARLRLVDGLTTVLAARVLCVHPQTVRDFVRDGLLTTTVVDIKTGVYIHVRRDSILYLLGRGGHLLPSFVDSEEWVDRRVGADEPMLSIAAILRAHSVRHNAVKALLESQQIPHIQSMGGHVLVPESDVQAHFRCSVSFLAQMFDVLPGTVRHWITHRLLCQQHLDGPAEFCPGPRCVVNYIAGHGVGQSAQSWYNIRATGQVAVCDAAEIADLVVGEDETSILEEVRAGELVAVTLPPSYGKVEVRALRSDAIAFKRRRERQLGGGDYY